MKRGIEFKTENGKLFMGSRKVERVDAGTCPYCNLPVYLSEGQLCTYKNNAPTHKSCRKNR